MRRWQHSFPHRHFLLCGLFAALFLPLGSAPSLGLFLPAAPVIIPLLADSFERGECAGRRGVRKTRNGVCDGPRPIAHAFHTISAAPCWKRACVGGREVVARAKGRKVSLSSFSLFLSRRHTLTRIRFLLQRRRVRPRASGCAQTVRNTSEGIGHLEVYDATPCATRRPRRVLSRDLLPFLPRIIVSKNFTKMVRCTQLIRYPAQSFGLCLLATFVDQEHWGETEPRDITETAPLF